MKNLLDSPINACSFWTTLGRNSLAASSAIALSLSFAAPAPALTLFFSGDTTNKPTFNRPQTEGFVPPSNPPTSLSGKAVPYSSQPFTVNTSGVYNIIGAQNFLGIQFLYQNSFDANNPLTNVISGDDPFPDEGNASFYNLPLTAQQQYFLVTTGFDDTSNSYGTFTNTISSVPEPAAIPGSIALLIFGRFLMVKYQPKKPSY
jgi:hypothetical protein